MMARRARVVEQEQQQLVQLGGGWWLTHGLPTFLPPIFALVWAVVIEGAHLAWGGSPLVTPLVAIVFFAIGGGVTVYGYATAGPRKHLKTAVTVSGVAATVTLVLGLVFGFVTRDFDVNLWLISVYVICILGVWPLWVIWRWSKYAGATVVQGDGHGMGELMDAARSAQVAFAAPKVDERGIVRAKVATLPGGVIENAQALLGPISSAARAVPGGATLTRHPDKDGLGEIEIATRDNLKRPIPWPGLTPEMLGMLPIDRFAVADYQSGPCRVRIVGDYRKDRSAPDVSHVKIGGVTGSGKSTGAQALLGSLMAMGRLNSIGLDVSTELQILGPLAGGLTWLITNPEEARLFLHRMNSDVITGRKAQLAREGLKRWTLDSSLNLTLVWVEESKEFGRLSSSYHKMVADARAAGIWVVSSTQSWIYRNLSTDVRKQHPSGICFGMTEADDVGHVLSEEAISALGGRLPTWGDTKPGYAYLAGLGVPEHMWPKMLRFYDPTREQLLEAVRVGAPYRSEMDPVTAELFGELFANRVRYGIEPAPAARSAAPARATARINEHQFDEEDVEDDTQEDAEAMAAEDYAQDRKEVLDELAAERMRDLGETATTNDLEDADPDEPISQLDDDDDEQEPEVQLTPQQAQRVWDDKLDTLYRSGVRHLRQSQLAEWLAEVGRERTFLYRQRDRWQDAKCIVVRPDAADGWDLVRSPLEPAPSPLHGE